MKKVVVLGAGYAGVLTAKKLAKKTKQLSDVEITIIDKNPFHTMLTELHEVAATRVDESSIRINLSKVFAGRNVNVVQDNVTKIDFEKRELKGEVGAYGYDYLVLASGSKPAFFGTPGAKEHSFTLWSYDDAVRLRDHIEEMFYMAAAEPSIEKKRELLTFYVVGAGFTGVEMMGELAEMVPITCSRFDMDPSLVTMVNVDMLDRVCMVLPPHLSSKVKARLEKMNVNVLLKTSIKGVGPNSIKFDRGSGIEEKATHTVIWTAGVEGSQISQDSKAIGEAKRGLVQTDEYLRSKNDKNVYVIGDNIFYTPAGEEKPVPQMVENAEQSAHIAAHNLFTDLTGSGEKHKYAPKFHGVMVCVGGRWGTAYGGMPGKFFGMPSFFAMFAKHFINITYFIQVLGWNKIFSYIKHEFFTIRNKRSFVGGHFSNRSPTFLLTPLRVVLGGFWIFEGVNKVFQGWLESPKLTGFLGSANDFWFNVKEGNLDALTAATGDDWGGGAEEVVDLFDDLFGGPAEDLFVDVVSSATGAESAAEVIINWDIFGLLQPMLIYLGYPENAAVTVKIPLLDKFMEFMIASDGVQMLLQSSIVIMEIVVGLALISGLFTTIVSCVSIVLQLMFFTTTGLYMSAWWMTPASIAMLFGAGQAFSLDYYVLPWLKTKWKNTKFARKWYLYHD